MSRTIVGLIIAFFGFIKTHLKWDWFDAAEAEKFLNMAIELVGIALAWYGRVKSKGQVNAIGFRKVTPLLLLLLVTACASPAGDAGSVPKVVPPESSNAIKSGDASAKQSTSRPKGLLGGSYMGGVEQWQLDVEGGGREVQSNSTGPVQNAFQLGSISMAQAAQFRDAIKDDPVISSINGQLKVLNEAYAKAPTPELAAQLKELRAEAAARLAEIDKNVRSAGGSLDALHWLVVVNQIGSYATGAETKGQAPQETQAEEALFANLFTALPALHAKSPLKENLKPGIPVPIITGE